MKKKLISLLLAVSLLLSFTLPVHAEDSFSIDSEAAYIASVDEKYNRFYANGYVDALLNHSGYSSYAAYQKVESSSIGGGMANFSMNMLHEDLNTDFWILHLAKVMQMQECGFEQAAANFTDYDTLKSFPEYAGNVIEILSGALDAAEFKTAFAEFLKESTEIAFFPADLYLSTLEDYQYALHTARNYQNHRTFLETIRKHTNLYPLKQAAEYLLDYTDKAWEFQISTMEKSAAGTTVLASSIFIPEVFEYVKSLPEYATDPSTRVLADWVSGAYNELGDLFGMLSGGFTLGIFAGDMFYGTTDTFKRYAELKANSILVDTLIAAFRDVHDWSADPAHNMEWIPEAVPLLQSIAILRARGEYVNVSLVTEDAQAMSLWQEICGKADVYREYYAWQEERLCTIWNELGKILQYTPFNNYELDFQSGDFIERDLDGDGETDILSCYQDGYEVVVAIASSVGGQIEYRATTMVPFGTLVGVDLGDGTVTLVICVATGMSGGAGAVYCPVYRLIDEEYVQVYESIETLEITGTADSSGANATIETQFGKTFTGAIEPPFADMAGKSITADPVYSVTFARNEDTGRMELIAKQYLWCYYHMGGVGTLQTSFELRGNELVAVGQTVSFYSAAESGDS